MRSFVGGGFSWRATVRTGSSATRATVLVALVASGYGVDRASPLTLSVRPKVPIATPQEKLIYDLVYKLVYDLVEQKL